MTAAEITTLEAIMESKASPETRLKARATLIAAYCPARKPAEKTTSPGVRRIAHESSNTRRGRLAEYHYGQGK